MKKRNGLYRYSSHLLWIGVIYFVVFLSGCGGSSDSSSDPSNSEIAATIRGYNQAFEGVVVKNHHFAVATQQWDGADLDSLSNTQALDLLNSFIEAGDVLKGSMDTLNTTIPSKSANNGQLEVLSPTYVYGIALKGATDELISLVPGDDSGLSPGLAKSIGDLPKGARIDVQKAMKDYPHYADGNSPDAYLFAQELKAIRREHSLKAVNTGVSSYMGVAGGLIGAGAAGYLISAGVVAVSAPAAVVVGAGVLGGYIGGKVINWMFTPSSCSTTTNTKVATATAADCFLTTGNIAAGGKIPNMFGEGGTLIFEIDGFAPITITNFYPPKDGHELVIDFQPVPVDQVVAGGTITVGFEEIDPVGVDSVRPPTASPTEREFSGSIEVTLSSPDGVYVVYSLNGVESFLYEGPITLTETKTITAYADTDPYDEDAIFSKLATFTYTKVDSNNPQTTCPWTYDPSLNDPNVGGIYGYNIYPDSQDRYTYVSCEYYDDDQLESSSPYAGGVEHGTWNSYHQNGQLQYTVPYIDGKKEGVFRSYTYGGCLYSERTYHNDVTVSQMDYDCE